VRQIRTFAIACIAILIAFAVTGVAEAGVLVTIDKASQRMTVTVDGKRKYVWPVSTGRLGYSTPSGTYHPFRMEPDWFSKEWDDAPMPHSIFFTARGHAIHGTYQTGRLGRPVSHGCVRLAPGNAATLYALVEKRGMGNTTVVVTGGGPSFNMSEVLEPIHKTKIRLGKISKKRFIGWDD
jgi:lipoprotein-anchoring transpeptidase ErfK/SrfK